MPCEATLTVPYTPAQRMKVALRHAAADGHVPVALYGAGAHARQIRAALIDSPARIVGFIDDDPRRQGATLLGFPILSREQALRLGVRCVILNSNTREAAMWSKRAAFEALGVHVRRLYPESEAEMHRTRTVPDIEAAMQASVRLPCDAVERYWATRGSSEASDENHPHTYHKNLGWSLLLGEWVESVGVAREAPILELGCNIGRNLAYLARCGYRNLTAVEINGNALEVMKQVHPATARLARLIHSPLEQALPQLNDGTFELVFSMAVLEHVHSDSDSIFPHIARVARRFVLTVEDEVGEGPRHFRRDYGQVFRSLGLREVRTRAFADADAEESSLLGLEREFVMRLFERV